MSPKLKPIFLIIIISLILLIITSLLLTFTKPKISSFEDCVAAGYPVMESYPRQCNANGQNFTETIITPPTIITSPPPSNKEVVCTLDAKICPDGSSVGRVGPNCEFALCP